MGACDFNTICHGKTMEEAFSRAHDDAAWEHGHGGYTGTIAEKYDAVLVGTLEAKDQQEAYDLIRKLWGVLSDAQEDHYDVGAHSFVPNPPLDMEKVPVAIRHLARREVFDLMDDKWGPAAAVEIIRPNLPSGHREFMFFGLASS